MHRVTTLQAGGNLRQAAIINRFRDRTFGVAKKSRRFCRLETCTRYVPTTIGSFLKSLQSDVSVLQEQPINCEQVN